MNTTGGVVVELDQMTIQQNIKFIVFSSNVIEYKNSTYHYISLILIILFGL